MAVDNRLKVQGRTERSTDEDKNISYKGEKIEENQDSNIVYVINDVVAKQQGQKFEKLKENWENYPKETFEEEVLNKKFKSESVYYKNMNDIFNTCKLTSYNIISMLQPFSPQTETRIINKDSSSNDIKEVLKPSLENFIAYYFYNMTLSKFSISLQNNDQDVEGTYMEMIFSYINRTSKNTQVATNKSLYFNIIDDLRFKISKESNPNINRKIQLCHKSSLPTFYKDRYVHNGSWGSEIYFYNYNYDSTGHVTSRSEVKKFKLPVKNKLYAVNYFIGDYPKGTKVILSEGIFACDLLEVVLKDPVDGYTKSVFIDGKELVKVSNYTYYFSGFKIVSEYASSGGSGYGGGGGFTVNLYAIVDDTVRIGEAILVPRVGKNNNWSKSIYYTSIIKVTGYYTALE